MTFKPVQYGWVAMRIADLKTNSLKTVYINCIPDGERVGFITITKFQRFLKLLKCDFQTRNGWVAINHDKSI